MNFAATTTSRRLSAGILAATTAGALLLVAPASADAAARLHCSASMSNSHPRQYSQIYVNIETNAASASVRTTAYYRTTTTSHSGKTSRHGNAAIAYRISRATSGFKVEVAVTVKSGKRNASCSTAFNPS